MSWSKPSGGSVGKVNSAQTFTESNLTISRTATIVDNGSVRLINGGTTASRAADNDTLGYADERGLVINPNTSLNGIAATISANCSIDTDTIIQVQRVSDSSELTRVDVSSYAAGDTVNIPVQLSSGTAYAVNLNNQTSVGRDTGPAFPYTSTDVDITKGWGAGSTTTNNAYAFSSIQADYDATSGSVIVEWPYPSDVYSWDRTFFDRVADSETVNVYIEEYSSGSWTEIAGPVKPGDKIPAMPSNNVRFRVELSRANTANTPLLTDIHRRRVLPGGS